MNNEIWKDIINYKEFYQVSNLGNVKRIKDNYNKSINRNTKSIRSDGYIAVKLHRNNIGKSFMIHRLVLEAFVGPCPDKMECRHLDGNRQNNNLKNLKWGTHKENIKDMIRHGTISNRKGSNNNRAKLNEKQVRIIKYLLKNSEISKPNIAKIFNVSVSNICDIHAKRTWYYI